jgi:hypothetical protein
MLSTIYGKEYSKSSAIQNVSAIAFAGTVLGQLIFGVSRAQLSIRSRSGALAHDMALGTKREKFPHQAMADSFFLHFSTPRINGLARTPSSFLRSSSFSLRLSALAHTVPEEMFRAYSQLSPHIVSWLVLE